jgi:dienelactone hydrolase
MRRAGHEVFVPDLFGGATAASVEEGMDLAERIGWQTAAARAEEAAAKLPPTAVLAGISYGTGLVAHLWPSRPAAAGVLLLHGPCEIADNARSGMPVQFHLAEPDPYEDEDFVAEWIGEAAARDLSFEAFRYPNAGHLFTDPTLDGYDEEAAATLWNRVDTFLSRL